MSNTPKPITVARQELITEMRELIDSCPLPYFVIESVLKDFYADVKILSQKQLEADTERYKNAQKKGD